MATKPEDQAGVNSNPDKDVNSLTELLERVSLSEVDGDKVEPGAVEQKVTMPTPANQAKDAGGAHKQKNNGNDMREDSSTSSKGEMGQGMDQQKTQKAPQSGVSRKQPTGSENEVSKTGHNHKDDRGIPECLQKSMRTIHILLKGLGKPSGCKRTVTLTDYMKYKFLEIDIGGTSEKIKQKLNIELSFNNKHILVLTFSEASEQFENIDSVMKRIFESMDDVEVNTTPLGCLDPTDLDDKMETKFNKEGIKFFSESDEEAFVYIYLKKDVIKVDNVIQSVIKTTFEEHGKKGAKVVTKKEEPSCLKKENECPEDFCIVYKNVFDSEKVKKQHGIQFESSDITVDEENNLIHLSRGRNWKGEMKKDMHTLKMVTENYPVNTVSFQDINWTEMESTTQVCGFLERFFSDMSKQFPEGESLFWYVNEKARKVSVCTNSQPYTDDITSKVKSCLLYKEIDLNDCQNFETLDDLMTEMNENYQGQCICLMKDNKISICGLKDYVKEAEKNLHWQLQRKEESRNQQDGNLGKGMHENGSPVRETNEKNAPGQEPPEKEMNPPGTGLSDNGTSDTTAMDENNATTESNAQINNTLEDDMNDDTAESGKPENGTPKTDILVEAAFKPMSNHNIELLMKQGSLAYLKTKYKLDIEINKFGLNLKAPNMALIQSAKDDIKKMEEDFTFIRHPVSLPDMQKDEIDEVINQSNKDWADVYVFQDESNVPRQTQKQLSTGRKWSHDKGHEIVLINGHVEHHWEELMIEIVAGNGKPDGPKQCEDGRWKVTVNIQTAEENKVLHSIQETLENMLQYRDVEEYSRVCLSLEPVGNLSKVKYAKKILHTVMTWLYSKVKPVVIYLCATEGFETYVTEFDVALETYPDAENITVETTTRSVRLTIIGLEDSNFQQAEEKIRKLAKEIKLKQYLTKQNTQGNERDQMPKGTDKKNEGKDGKEDQFTPETYLIITKPASVEKIETELGKLEDCKPIKIVDGPLVQGILLICQNEEDAIKLIRKKKKTFEAQKLKKTGLKWKTMRIREVLLSDDIKRELREAQVRVFGKNKDILQAPTLHQIDFAKGLIESTVKTTVKPKEVKKPGEKSDSDKATAKPKEVTEPVKKSDTVEIQEVPELVYELLKIKEKLGELNQKGEKIEYSKGCLRCPSAVQELSEKLKKMELDEIVLQGEEKKMDVKTFCDEINKNMKKDLCVYDSEKQRVILYADAYDDMQKVKHQLNVKLERIKVTARRGRRQMKTLEDTSPQIKIDFVWNRDAKNKEVFRTKEGMHVYVYEASIIKLPVECIVNAANDTMMHGGGIAKVIARAAGRRLDAECSTILRNSGKVQVGRNIVTTAGDLPYRSVIHAVGPRWSDYYPHTLSKVKECEQDLYDAVYGSLVAAENQRLKTIALPAISSAIFGVPEQLCVYQYAKATLDYSKYSAGKDSFLTEVHFIDINADIVKKIQDMFSTMVRDDKDPGYDSQEFATRPLTYYSGSRDHGQSGQGNFQKGKQPQQHQDSLDVPKREDRHLYQGNLHVHNEDLFLLKIKQKTAVVMFVNRSLNPHGRVAFKLVDSIYKKNSSRYIMERNEKNRKYKDIFVTGGYGCGFDQIIHVVSEGFKNMKSYKERKTQAMKVYGSILDLACKVKYIAAVVMTLIRTGDGPDDLKLSVEAFKESYENKMVGIADRNIAVHIVCNDDKVHVVFNTLDMKPTVPPRYVEPRNPVSQQPGGYPSTSDTWNNYNQGATAHLKDNRNSGGDDRDMRKDKDSSGANKEDRGAAGIEDKVHGAGEEKRDSEENNCVICMDKMDDDSTILKCGHSFCTGCIDQQFKYKQACPTCGVVCGIIKGDQPDGTMKEYVNRSQDCAGYPGYGRIEITYCFFNGRQGQNHPSPGAWYKGINRTAYLPNNNEGREICAMLRVAFDRKLVFTIGRSTTTGQEGVITWNDIHHKTDPTPDKQFGYPDDTYLNRVREELAAKGITPKDIPTAYSSY